MKKITLAQACMQIVRVYDMKNPTHQGKLFCAKLLVQIFKKESEVKYVTGTGTHALKRF